MKIISYTHKDAIHGMCFDDSAHGLLTGRMIGADPGFRGHGP
jgi:hypothetical protein